MILNKTHLNALLDTNRWHLCTETQSAFQTFIILCIKRCSRVQLMLHRPAGRRLEPQEKAGKVNIESPNDWEPHQPHTANQEVPKHGHTPPLHKTPHTPPTPTESPSPLGRLGTEIQKSKWTKTPSPAPIEQNYSSNKEYKPGSNTHNCNNTCVDYEFSRQFSFSCYRNAVMSIYVVI